ncbi:MULTISPECIES: hypothetical protein [unclassified Streptomyces]|uniref:hypothetical protein n=1 Tax=unclassified Streptomyces TaxID=2593676 RepID=UPI0036F9D98B
MHRTDGPVVLTLDYPGFRKEARIDELGLDRHGVRVHELLRAPLPRAVSGAAYAARLLAGLPPQPGPVAAIAAYCASAPLAFEVAAALGGPPPLIVLFDPEATTWDTVTADYRARLAGLGIPPDGQGDPVGDRAATTLADDPQRFVDALTGELARLARAALREAGADEAEVTASATHLVGAYTDWLCHLVAARHARTSGWPGEVLCLTSADAVPSGIARDAGRRAELRLPCDRFELLRSEEARAAVLDALGLPREPYAQEGSGRCPSVSWS